uniref:Uncharacterized protein AlNc14C194G8523 n=1 Tax=Albugo laibachii Nc14 TaxID=890382 RepID=F0WQ43_9STRA|nr:conserved hypothetical protein [Albugo laibachii Nc14]|eukprot:CCA23448.1 conserved hypothetical protein [Albugo laibachii Nc14]
MDFTDLTTVDTCGESTSTAIPNEVNRSRLLPLLENGRKNSYQCSEAPTQKSSSILHRITHKRDLVEAVRKVNTPLVFPSRRQDGSNNSAMKVLSPMKTARKTPEALPESNTTISVQNDLSSLRNHVLLQARKYNELKMRSDMKERELCTLLDELQSIQLETHELKRIERRETPIAHQNAKMQQEIAQSTAISDEQTTLHRRYQQMIRRLIAEQVSGDAQLTAITERVHQSTQECNQVKELSRHLESGRNRTMQIVQDLHHQLKIERRFRQKELNEREIRAKNAKRMERWRQQRIQDRNALEVEFSVDEKPNQTVSDPPHATQAAPNASLKSQFRSIDPNQMQVRSTQMRIRCMESLQEELLALEAKASLLRRDKHHTQIQYDTFKSSGGPSCPNREEIASISAQLAELKAFCKVSKSELDRLLHTIVFIRQGSQSLAQRLIVFDDILKKELGNWPQIATFDGISDTSEPFPNDHGRDVFQRIHLRLMGMLRIIDKHRENIDNTLNFPLNRSIPLIHPNNIRVCPSVSEHTLTMDTARSSSSITDTSVPSRKVLKLCSVRQSADQSRRKVCEFPSEKLLPDRQK